LSLAEHASSQAEIAQAIADVVRASHGVPSPSTNGGGQPAPSTGNAQPSASASPTAINAPRSTFEREFNAADKKLSSMTEVTFEDKRTLANAAEQMKVALAEPEFHSLPDDKRAVALSSIQKFDAAVSELKEGARPSGEAIVTLRQPLASAKAVVGKDDAVSTTSAAPTNFDPTGLSSVSIRCSRTNSSWFRVCWVYRSRRSKVRPGPPLARSNAAVRPTPIATKHQRARKAGRAF